jgi:sugar phosphate permease
MSGFDRDHSMSSRAPLRPPDPARTAGENGVIWTIWLTYGAFYFCRTNISAAVPGLTESIAAGGAGLSEVQVGYILASLKLTYGLGQFFNGQLAEYVSSRKLLALGMLGSAALNVLFGFGTGFYFLLFVWACNGYCQSLGWTPCVRVIANWIPILRRGKAIGIVGTGYQVTLGLTYVIAGQSVQYLGWRGALYVPAALLAATAVFMWLCLEDAPSDDIREADEQTFEDESGAAPESVEQRPTSFVESLIITLANQALWLLGLSLGFLNACRYGYLDWGLKHLTDAQATGVGQAALKYAVLPIGAVAGSYGAGWATDRFFGGRRAPVMVCLLVLLGGLGLIYDAVARSSVAGTLLLLVGVGFCIYGPQVLLVGTAPADLARRGTSAAAAGFVNFMGYMGAAAGDTVTGYLLQHYDWQRVIYFWAGCAIAAALAAGLLWNATAPRSSR